MITRRLFYEEKHPNGMFRVLGIVSVLLFTCTAGLWASYPDVRTPSTGITDTQQAITVTGTVVDESGEPVVGANVAVKGTTIGIITDNDGKFTLNVPSSSSVIVISYIGYKTQEITVGNQRTLSVTLAEDNLLLDEVVVVAYGTQKKKDLTGAIATVDTKVITSQSNSSVSKVLEGAVPGIQVSATEGQPGMDMTIRVRGLGSFDGNNANALIVIDGVPQQNANILTTVNPNDIANMTVLKDAASTALYGSRGANGVVLITTKQGSSGKAKITVDTRWGINTLTNNTPDLITDPKDIYEHQWLLNYNTYRYADGITYSTNNGELSVTNPLHTDDEARLFASQHLFNYMGNSKNLQRNGLNNWLLYSFPGWNDASNYASSGASVESRTMLNNYLVGTDGKLNPAATLMYNDSYYDALVKDRMRQEYNIAASGGSDKIDYNLSMGLLSDPSYIQNSSFDRYVGRGVFNAKVTDWLKVGTNVSFTYRKTQGQPTREQASGGIQTQMGDNGFNVFSVVFAELPVQQLYAHNPDGSYIYNADGTKMVHIRNGAGESVIGPTNVDSWGNVNGDILKRMQLDKNYIYSHYLTTRTYADIHFLKDFTFTTNLSVDASFDYISRYLNSTTGGLVSYGGAYNKQNSKNINLNTQQLLNYNHDFGVHHVDALAAHEYNQYQFEEQYFTSSHSLIPDYAAYANFVDVYSGARAYVSAIRYNNPGGNMWRMAMESYFARANYIYDNKYYASASLRYDGSSKFKLPEQRWGTFWSVGGGYRITQEAFMEGVRDWLNNLKVRASYGVIGNQNGLGTYATYQTWTVSANYGATAAGTAPTRILSSFNLTQGNRVYENLTWENVNTTDIGIDFDLFNRIHGSFDWYNRETVNAFFSNTFSQAAKAFTLTTAMTMNNAKIRNRGFELDLNVDLITTKDLYWSVGLNGTHFETTLTKLPAGQGSDDLGGNIAVQDSYIAYLRGEGKPFYNIYMYKYEGVNPDTGAPLYHHIVTEADHSAGYFTDSAIGASVKTSNTSRITALDRVEKGDAVPDWIGGFNTNVRYKNFDFGATFAYQVGGKIFWNDGIYYYESDWGRDRPHAIDKEIIGNTWTPDNRNAKFPIAVLDKANSGSFGFAANPGLNNLTDMLLFSASYFNVKNITLGYTLPKSLVNKAHIGNLRIYASGDNLYMKSAHRGLEPRVSLTGNNFTYGYPYLRVYNVGLNLEF